MFLPTQIQRSKAKLTVSSKIIRGMSCLIFKVKVPAPTIIALKRHVFLDWPKLTNVMN